MIYLVTFTSFGTLDQSQLGVFSISLDIKNQMQFVNTYYNILICDFSTFLYISPPCIHWYIYLSLSLSLCVCVCVHIPPHTFKTIITFLAVTFFMTYLVMFFFLMSTDWKKERMMTQMAIWWERERERERERDNYHRDNCCISTHYLSNNDMLLSSVML